jgi:hypothetical protein
MSPMWTPGNESRVTVSRRKHISKRGRKTADPSATLGMTKGTAAAPLRAAAERTPSVQQPFFYGSLALPFVIPSVAEGSAIFDSVAAGAIACRKRPIR